MQDPAITPEERFNRLVREVFNPLYECGRTRVLTIDVVEDLTRELIELQLLQGIVRTQTVELQEVDIRIDQAIDVARNYRRDWMNARGRLVDQWRLLQFNADQLQGALDIVFSGDIGNVGDNPFNLRADRGHLRAGVQFDAPLTRLGERNAYRQSLIEYQQARRAFYLFEDQVAQGLRGRLRSLTTFQINFELNRLGVLEAARQVMLNTFIDQEEQRTLTTRVTAARDAVQALTDLLNAQNQFMLVFISYEVQRLALDFNLGTMQLDAEGLWIDPGKIGPDYGSFDPWLREYMHGHGGLSGEEIEGVPGVPGKSFQHDPIDDLPPPSSCRRSGMIPTRRCRPSRGRRCRDSAFARFAARSQCHGRRDLKSQPVERHPTPRARHLQGALRSAPIQSDFIDSHLAMSARSAESSDFSLTAARQIVRDLFTPREWIYWTDFLSTIFIGYLFFGLTRWLYDVRLEPLWLRLILQLATFLVQCICYYRAVMFVHEIVHLPERKFRAFRVVWNLLCGIPFLVPSFTYYTHLDHHRRKLFGTADDGEYLPLASLSPWWIGLYLSQCLWVPALALVRFGVLTPLMWISPRLRKFVYRRASSLVMDPAYLPPAAHARSPALHPPARARLLLVHLGLRHGPAVAARSAAAAAAGACVRDGRGSDFRQLGADPRVASLLERRP